MADQIEFINTKKKLRTNWLLEQPRRTYLELALTFATIAFFAIFALRPTIVTISELIAKERNLAESDEKLKTKITNLQKAQELLNNATPQLGLIEEALPSSPQVAYFMSTVNTIASEYQVKINNIVFEEVPVGIHTSNAKNKKNSTSQPKTKKDSPWEEVTFTVSIEGRYDNLREFVLAIGQLRRPIINPSLTISLPQDEESISGVLTAVVSAQLPYIPQYEQTKK